MTDTSQNLANDALAEVNESDKLAETLESLQRIIERNADELEEVGKKLREFRESLRNYFENDTDLSEAESQATQFVEQLKTRKAQLRNHPQVVTLHNKIGEANEKKKEIQEALSNHLLNYYTLTNSTSFDTSDGDQREFTIKASVRSRGRKKNF